MTVFDSQPIRGRGPVQGTNSVKRTGGSKNSLPPSGQAGKADSVAISPQIFELGMVMDRLRGLPDIRAALLEPVQQRLASNEFNIPGERVATGVVKETVLNSLGGPLSIR